jgi:flavin-dependent dehydrogenase
VKFDVIIIGSGPAGAATAIDLVRRGRSVAILEQSEYDSVRIGETLPPEIRIPLAKLGVWERFCGDSHLASPGTVSLWGEAEPSCTDFLFNPYGNGWHINRRQFDSMLAKAAECGGASVYRGTRVTACEKERSGLWRLEAQQATREQVFQAGFLVLATGRAGIPPRIPPTFTGRRKIYDRLVGCIKILDLESSNSKYDHRTLIEATEDGWWYSALLPQRQFVFGFFTDGDRLRVDKISSPENWMKQLSQASYTRQRVLACEWNSSLRVVAASSSCRSCTAFERWIMVGDAATAFDPLSGKGIYNALLSGLAAAATIDDSLRGHRLALDHYAAQVITQYSEYLVERAKYYAREQRWPNSIFWLRRHAQNANIE